MKERTQRILAIAYVIGAVLVAAYLTLRFTGGLPFETVNHCPQSEQFTCPSTTINLYPMIVYMGLALGVLSIAPAVIQIRSRRST